MDQAHNVERLQVKDSLFAEAYTSLGPARRSVLKKWIAQYCLFWGRNRQHRRCETISWDQGLVTTVSERPLDWALVVLSGTFASPAQLLALLMPVLLAGTGQIIVVRENEESMPFPGPVLVAMELAGQETVLQGTGAQLMTVIGPFAEMCGPFGRVFCLGEPDLASRIGTCLPGQKIWSARKQQQAGIWFDQGSSWDLETIGWMLQGTCLHTGGAVPDSVPESFTRHEGSLEAFMRHDFGALYLPRPESCPLYWGGFVFGQGQEGGWLWPGITTRTFTVPRVVWHGESGAHKENIDGRS